MNLTFAYMAPEMILPMASVVTGSVGFILLVGRAPVRLAAKGFRYAARGLQYTARGFRAIVGKLDL